MVSGKLSPVELLRDILGYVIIKFTLLFGFLDHFLRHNKVHVTIRIPGSFFTS